MTTMTKRGSLDNVVTYEHFCDTTADLATIDPKYATQGSVAIVIQGTAGLEAYIANSQGEWILVSATPTDNEEEETEPSGSGEG